MTARSSMTSQRLPEEPLAEVVSVFGDAPPSDAGPGGGPGGPGGGGSGPLTARVVHIFSAIAHGSQSAPVSFGPDQLLQGALHHAFHRVSARRHHQPINQHSKGTR